MSKAWSVGSRWQRWDPHLHAPGTLRNNQFGNDWDNYLKRIDEARPAPVALGITDYFTLRGYKAVLERRKNGALQDIPLIFANIELRLTIETTQRKGINVHLLVSPDDPHHVALMEEKLGSLSFAYRENEYFCTDDGLRRLGRAHLQNQTLPDDAALAEGAGQFKVDLNQLRQLFARHEWIRDNVLVAIAAGADGLSGIAKDSQFHAQREELGRFAHIVFSATPSDRTFWLGKHSKFVKEGQSPKPCLMGCDAHDVESVLRPPASPDEAGAEPRVCWIRAEATFDGLRQTLVEPERRVHIGENPPAGPSPSDVIHLLRIKNAGWVKTNEIALNDGLVTIIGARGSGKTALADLLASAADATDDEPGTASFLAKAGTLLTGLEAEIEWADGSTQSATFPGSSGLYCEPRVRYLSQKFVETLCSSSEQVDGGKSEPLNDEIEHVVFSAIPEENRLGCGSFAELRGVRVESCWARQEEERENIRQKTRLIGENNVLRGSVDTLKAKTTEAERARKALELELKGIPSKASDATAKAYAVASEKLNALKATMATESRNEQSLRDLRAEADRQARSAESNWLALKTKYGQLLPESEWGLLRLRMDERAVSALEKAEALLTKRIESLRQHGQTEAPPSANAAGIPQPLGLVALEAECKRLTDAMGLDQANAKKRVDLEQKLTTAKRNEEKAREVLKRAEGAGVVLDQLRSERGGCYQRVFESLDAEQVTLNELYGPLRARLGAEPRLAKLSFAVERVVDLEGWAERGEQLLDLRKPPFTGKGTLAAKAKDVLLPAWRSGTPEEVRTAMDAFARILTQPTLAQNVTFADFGAWLFSTEHIAIRYAIRYEGLDLNHLSPGTRGVVLLTLYLALDHWDRRPMVIDQPEENLDPRSVYEELVPFFVEAAKRRQIIMVTHNANLVVNTDSDQVIVAESQRTAIGQLPQVTYLAGGLEDPAIRDNVCRLLEGGKEAFSRRQKRYTMPST